MREIKKGVIVLFVGVVIVFGYILFSDNNTTTNNNIPASELPTPDTDGKEIIILSEEDLVEMFGEGVVE